MAFSEYFAGLDWDQQQREIYAKTDAQVQLALVKNKLDFEDFKALLSPAAEPHLEAMANKAVALTRQRFGYGMQLFAPLYLSNVCSNVCTYCGFSIDNKLRRKTLNDSEIIAEAKALKKKNIDQVLLVTGEAEKTVGVDYLAKAMTLLRPFFAQISIEVQPLKGDEYQRLIACGLHGVSLYQETYHAPTYREHHTRGKKADMVHRLNAVDTLGQQGVHKIAVGVLLGLQDWRTDSLFCAQHLRYLQKRYWQTSYSVSFPRLRPSEGSYEVAQALSDAHLVQLIVAWRLFDCDLDLTLSTRESAALRDKICGLGITSMSAESSTQPGGYTEVAQTQLQQFEISDQRNVAAVTQMLSQQGFEVIATDWKLSR